MSDVPDASAYEEIIVTLPDGQQWGFPARRIGASAPTLNQPMQVTITGTMIPNATGGMTLVPAATAQVVSGLRTQTNVVPTPPGPPPRRQTDAELAAEQERLLGGGDGFGVGQSRRPTDEMT